MNVLDAQSLLTAFGVAGIAAVLFAETGLLVGFFLPGDSLLFTAGLLCTGTSTSSLNLSLPLVLLSSALGALAGAQCGYLIGRKAGGALLARSRSEHLRKGRRAPRNSSNGTATRRRSSSPASSPWCAPC